MRVYLDGEFLQESAARIAPADAGLLRGEGVFETLRVVDGQVLDLSRHLDRLGMGMQALGIVLADGLEELARAARQLAAGGPVPLARMRMTVTAGHDGHATRLVTVQPWQAPDAQQRRAGVPVIVAPGQRLDSQSPLRAIKSTSYALQSLAARAARRAGAAEALLGNERGELAEGSRSNVFVLLGGKALTPPLSSGCLPGIARARVLEAGLATERVVTLEELRVAQGLLLSNSLIGVLPVASIDGRPLAVDATASTWQRHLEAAWQRG